MTKKHPGWRAHDYQYGMDTPKHWNMGSPGYCKKCGDYSGTYLYCFKCNKELKKKT